MFIRQNLIKEINTLYYTHYKEQLSGLIAVNNNSLIFDVMNNIGILQDKENEFYKMHMDLLHYDTGIFSSIIAMEQEKLRVALGEKIEKYINKSIITEIKQILTGLSNNACLVGGCIRDIILDKTPKDFDFVTDTPYEILKSSFIENGFAVKENGKHFMVITITKNQQNFEIANFRKDSIDSDGRRPDFVEIGNIFDDAHRRDFTINAIFYKLTNNVLMDPTGNGIPDIGKNLLRFIGNPEDRLKEDYLRGWRFLRFVKRGFTPETRSYRVVKSLWGAIYSQSNPQRVLKEIINMI